MKKKYPPHKDFLSFAIELADMVRPILQTAAVDYQDVEIKKDHSFVTRTDKEIEKKLRSKIADAYPNHGLFGEEYGTKNLDAEFVWVLDPIDGTAPFIAGIPVYGSLIALAWKGSPFLGIIEQPATCDRWVGVAHNFTLFNEKPVYVRSCGNLQNAFATCSNPDYMSTAQRLSLNQLIQHTSYMQYGGACFAYGKLASGKTDIAIDAGLKAFDLFAPAAVITGAGGVISNWDGLPLTLDLEGDVLAAGDKRMHEEVILMLKDAGV